MNRRILHPFARYIVIFLLALALLPASVAGAPQGNRAPDFQAQEVASNQLSYPVILADGVSTGGLPTSGTASATLNGIPWVGVATDADGNLLPLDEWYLQKDPLNTWQADIASHSQAVGIVSWADNLLQAWPAGSKIRVETVFFLPASGMNGYMMGHVSGTGIDEVWGTNGELVTNQTATIYSPSVTLDIQDANGVSVSGYPISYTAEINVQGKVIYGGLWDTAGVDPGTYTMIVTVPATMPLTGTINHGTIDSTATTSHDIVIGDAKGGGNDGGGGGGGQPDDPGGGGKPTDPGGGGAPPDDPGSGGGGGGGQVPDIDGDGLVNMDDNCVDTYNPLQENWDGDEAGDVCDDSDLDGLTDWEEMFVGTDGYITDRSDLDTDDDLLSDGDEVVYYRTNPTLADTDGDSYSDSAEISAGTDPNDAASYPGVTTTSDGPVVPAEVEDGGDGTTPGGKKGGN